MTTTMRVDVTTTDLGRPATATRALLWKLVLLCVGVRVLLEIVGLTALAVDGEPVLSNVIDVWRRWDAQHYLRLAEAGYQASSPSPNEDDQYLIVFFPFYPLLVHLVSLVVLDVVASGLLVSFAASVGAGYFLFRLVALDDDEAAAWRAVLLLFAFPTAYFLAAPFTEATFLCAVLAAVYSARTGSWRTAGLAGAFATGTRITGLVLLPTLAVEALTSAGDRVRRLRWVAVSGAGVAVYLAINLIVFADTWHFLDVQREHWFQEAVPPWVPVSEAVNALLAGGNDETFAIIFSGRLLGFALAVALLVAGWRMRPADLVLGWAGLTLLTSAAWLLSLPRYLIVLYPLFIVGSRLTRSRWVLIPVLVVSASLQGYFMWRYATGEWTF